MKKTLLWLDDIRDPFSNQHNNYIAKNIYNPLKLDIIWVKNYEQYKLHLELNKMPDIISYDHDLGEVFLDDNNNEHQKVEKTGYDAAKFLIEMALNNPKLILPEIHCHSANPVGKENIERILNNYKKLLK